MQNVVLTVHLILAALLIGVVLLQRSEGGGLGIGGGGGVMTGRQAANALSKATWILATGFLITSLALFVIAGRQAGSGSVLDRIGGGVPAPTEAPAGNLPALPTYTPPPAAGQPITPPAPAGEAAAPAATAPATPAAPPAPAVEQPAAAPAHTAAAPEGDGTAPAATAPVQTPPAD